MSTFVLGAGGHARVVISVLKANGLLVTGATDRNPALAGKLIEGVEIVGSDETILPQTGSGINLYNGVGNAARASDSGLGIRRELFMVFAARGFQFPPLISSKAAVASSAKVGEGAQVLVAAVVQPGAEIGENSIVNTAAIVEHDCIVGAHCHLAPGAILCGGVRLGDQCHIGAGAIVLQGRHIPPGSVVPAGSVVRSWKQT